MVCHWLSLPNCTFMDHAGSLASTMVEVTIRQKCYKTRAQNIVSHSPCGQRSEGVICHISIRWPYQSRPSAKETVSQGSCCHIHLENKKYFFLPSPPQNSKRNSWHIFESLLDYYFFWTMLISALFVMKNSLKSINWSKNYSPSKQWDTIAIKKWGVCTHIYWGMFT